MKKKQVRFIDLSDIHLLHQRVPTVKIIQELDSVINYEKLNDIDIIFISGDLFDNLVSMAQDSLHYVFDWMYRLLKLCKHKDIQLRVLEGTPSHDWKQSKWLETINERFDVKADLIYFPALAIEYNAKYHLNILYVPDEWRSKTEDTYKEVLALMEEKGLKQVDIAIMHGAFQYQLPEVARGKVPMHKEEDYLPITKYVVIIGHVHKQSTYERILVPGSFSRLAHGEEEPKGYYDVTIYDDETFTAEFKENPLATKFITIDVGKLNNETEVLSFIKEKIHDLPKGSHIRVRAPVGHFSITSKMVYVTHFPEYIWTLMADKPEEEKPIQYDADDTVNIDEINQITIDKDNVIDLVMKRLESRMDDTKILAMAKDILEKER